MRPFTANKLRHHPEGTQIEVLIVSLMQSILFFFSWTLLYVTISVKMSSSDQNVFTQEPPSQAAYSD